MRILVSSIVILLVQITYAQPKAVKPESYNDAEAKKYLSLIKSKIEKSKGYKIDYMMTLEDANKKTTKSTGTYLGVGNKYIVETDEVKTYNNGQTQWVLNASDMEIHISSVSETKRKKSDHPIDIIKSYDKLFKYRVKEPKRNNQIILELIPKNKYNKYFKVDVAVNKTSLKINYVKLYDRGGHRIRFQFTNMSYDSEIPISMFSLEPKAYPSYEVLDLR